LQEHFESTIKPVKIQPTVGLNWTVIERRIVNHPLYGPIHYGVLRITTRVAILRTQKGHASSGLLATKNVYYGSNKIFQWINHFKKINFYSIDCLKKLSVIGRSHHRIPSSHLLSAISIFNIQPQPSLPIYRTIKCMLNILKAKLTFLSIF